MKKKLLKKRLKYLRLDVEALRYHLAHLENKIDDLKKQNNKNSLPPAYPGQPYFSCGDPSEAVEVTLIK